MRADSIVQNWFINFLGFHSDGQLKATAAMAESLFEDAAGIPLSETVDYLGLDEENSVVSFGCSQLNISVCAQTESDSNIVMAVYNPLGKDVDAFVRIPTMDNHIIQVISNKRSSYF